MRQVLTNQCTWPSAQTANTLASACVVSDSAGNAKGSSAKYHTKYCAVLTLLKATKAKVCINMQNGRSPAYTHANT